MIFRQLDKGVMEKVLSTTPGAISTAIETLCQDIAPGQTPTFIEHRPAPAARPRECFSNVADEVSRCGGELVFGWAIWEWPDIFIEAEHHSVWRSGEQLIDITPHECPTNGVLFLPDPSAPYDFEGQTRRNNVRRPLTDALVVHDWLAASDHLHHLLEARSVGGTYRLSPADQRAVATLGMEIEKLKAGIYFHLAEKLSVNSRCFCSSGRKFKKCCGPYFR